MKTYNVKNKRTAFQLYVAGLMYVCTYVEWGVCAWSGFVISASDSIYSLLPSTLPFNSNFSALCSIPHFQFPPTKRSMKMEGKGMGSGGSGGGISISINMPLLHWIVTVIVMQGQGRSESESALEWEQ